MDQEFTFQSAPGSQVYIQLETDGDSSGGNDACYYDNVYFYGQGSAANPTESPTDTTLAPTSVTQAPTQATTSPTTATTSPSNAPTSITNAPTSVTASPTQDTTSPTTATSSPTTATQSPTSMTQSPTQPTATPTTAPTVITSSPTANTQTPTAVTGAPTLATISPTTAPTAITSSPTSVTLSPTQATQSPTSVTAPPSVSPNPVLIFYDDMTTDNAWMISSSVHVIEQSSSSRCTDPDNLCIEIEGYEDEDCYIRRSVPNDYNTYILKFDIALSGMESENYCRIKYSFDGITYTELPPYKGNGGAIIQLLNQQFTFSSAVGSQLYIQLETDGDSSSGGDACYYDNVYLYGQGQAANPTESPTDSTSAPTSPTQSPTQATTSPTTATTAPSNAPTGITNAPSSITASPTQETLSPTTATSSPTAASQSPTSVTQSPTQATSTPTNAPTVVTSSPTTNTQSPTEVTAAPTIATVSPTTAPTASTSSPTSVTLSPTANTQSPTEATQAPTSPTASPTIASNPVLIFYDDMNTDNSWTISSSSHVQEYTSSSRCTDPDNQCLRIRGYDNEDCYVKRSVANSYNTYKLIFDVTLYGMESPNYCRIKYSFDDSTYTELVSYRGNGITTPLSDEEFTFSAGSGSQLYIKLETDGDSSGGGDSCFYDNVYLYGDGSNGNPSPPTPTLIFFDGMGDTNNWIESSSNHIQLYYDGLCIPNSGTYDCVKITGYLNEDCFLKRSVTNNYASYTLELDIIPWGMHPNQNEYCIVSYSFDDINWTVLAQTEGSNGAWEPFQDQEFTFNGVGTATSLYIKLEAVGQDQTDQCVFDNVYLYGTV